MNVVAQGSLPRNDRAIDRQGHHARHCRGDWRRCCATSARRAITNLHPFHRLLHGGKLNKGQVQAWALNRYYYQSTIPLKDAMVISRFRDRNTRIEWRHRIEDHDGDPGSEGGIERWLKLTEGLGLDTAYVESTEGITAGDALCGGGLCAFLPRPDAAGGDRLLAHGTVRAEPA